ncbi:ABC transporter permease [Salinisphaera hydrothermalis]|uniref:Inner-membrane translocator n=1 Tax=Salinisphaera hydrothermalis (strain C41B8) TaxID=1304275 RepID=A0A084IPE2_SALHC|nr:ABC transporter permease [Salinisphaera hydrothermalis]KEZ78576.1 inner-membrane translocator [Salinisphaera hydrothermalis C41B8]
MSATLPHMNIARHRGLLIAIGAFVTVSVLLQTLSRGGLTYFDLSFLSAGGAPLAIAAIGETLVILSGGFDLSAAAVVSLTNVFLAAYMPDTAAGQILFPILALGIGGLVGAVNGLFVGFLRLPAIVVTLATMFIVQGVTLLVMSQPGGAIPGGFVSLLSGDTITGVLPTPIVVVLAMLGVWWLIKHSRLGLSIYAIGSDASAAQSTGINERWARFWTFVLAGVLYAAAGVFVSAQTGSGDPHIGDPMLLQLFTAVVLGGTLLGGGRGGALGSVLGAYVIQMTANVLLVLNISPYYTTVAESVILLLAVLATTLSSDSQAMGYLRYSTLKIGRRWRGTRPLRRSRADAALPKDFGGHVAAERRSFSLADLWTRHGDQLRFVMPAYVLFGGLLAITFVMFAHRAGVFGYVDSLLVLTSFLAILGLGQGLVILTGGLDLSLPWNIAASGILLTQFVHGSNEAALWVIPLVLLFGSFAGLLNGIGVAILGISPIVVTLAMNGLLQGFALVLTGGAPQGWTAPFLQTFMTGEFLGVTPVIWFLIAFVAAGTLLLTRTTFGRQIYAVGNSESVARLSGVSVGRTLIAAYTVSGLCAALAGVLLTGFNGQAFNGMGDPYLLSSIAVVVVGGTLITGGRGHYLGILGGALALTALDTLLAGTMLSDSVKSIVYGCVVLAAVLALRERA